jgi:hypothetical protein
MAAPIGKVQVVLTGFQGAPGLINLYWNSTTPGTWVTADSTAAIAAVYAFLNAVRSAFYTSVTLQVQPNVEVVESLSGALIGVVPGTPVASIVGLGTGQMLSAEGPLVQWLTSDVVGRRLARGRTFLTPSASGALEALGGVAAALQSLILSNGATYIATSGPSPVIWHRPHPFATGMNGSAHEITAVGAPKTVAVLRSRRD